MGKYKDQILKLREEGNTYSNICKILGCSMSLISYYTISTERKRELERGARSRKDGSVYEKRNRFKNRNRKIVEDYLNGRSCVDCGNTDVRVLEFDHVRDVKAGNISHAVHRAWSIDKLLLEIDKCEIRCCNCHRIATIERRKIKKIN